MSHDRIVARAIPDDDGPNVDSLGNRFRIDPESVLWSDIPDYLDFCGCGEPWLVNTAIMNYLSALNHDIHEWDKRPPMDEIDSAVGGRTSHLFCAYICANLGWTEHGGSVLGSWITPEGKISLARLKEDLR